MLNYLEDALAAKGTTLGTVVHIGAGKCAELDTYLNLGATSIILAEGSNRFSRILEKRALRHQNILIKHCVVVPDSKHTPGFNIYKDERFNSVLELDGKQSDLELMSSSAIECISASALITEVEAEPSNTNLLVIEAQGTELQLLESIRPEDLQKFEFIVISSARTPLYEHGASMDKVKSLMENRDYHPSLFHDTCSSYIEQFYCINTKPEMTEAQAEHDKQLAELSAKVDEFYKDRRLAQKMLAKSQVDLDDMRRKYDEKVEREQALVELIMELRDKLQAASSYYFKLRNNHPEIVANDID